MAEPGEAVTDADARDDRAGRPARWRPWLLLVLAFTLAPRAVDDTLAARATLLAAHNPWRVWFPLATGAVEVVGFIAAGVLIDRHGIRIVAALSLFAWAAVIAALAVFVRDSPLLYLMHDGAIFVGLFFALAASVAAKHAAPFVRRARFLAILDLASTGWLLSVPAIASAADWPPAPSTASAWTKGGFVIAGGGALLALLWLVIARSRDIATPPAEAGDPRIQASFGEVLALLRRPGLMVLVVVMACHLLTFSTLYRVLAIDVVRIRFLPIETFERSLIGPLVAFALTKLALAFWSDAAASRTGSPASARVPFVAAGAALAATIGLLPFVGNGHLGLVLWPLAVGMAGFPLVFPLALDIVPSALAGRFLGVAFAISMVITLAVFTLASVLTALTHDLSWYFRLTGIAALIAAVLSWAALRKLTPLDDQAGLARAIGKVFA